MIKQSSNINIKASLCHVGGYLFFALGFAGIFLPLLPTTIFWILAVWAFAKVHPEMVTKIYEWPKIGSIIEDYVIKGIISKKSKITAALGISTLGGLSLWITNLHPFLASFIALTLASVVIFVFSRPSK